MFFPETLQTIHSAVAGALPGCFAGKDAPDGDRGDWKDSPTGTIYKRVNPSNRVTHTYEKVKDDLADNDWVEGMGVISETVGIADFTDGGAAAGTVTLTKTIPIGAFVLRATIVDLTGFTGDTSAVITVGDGTDVDRYNASTPDVFSDLAAADLGAPSGTQIHATAATVTITITSDSDFTAVTAGELTIRIYYLN